MSMRSDRWFLGLSLFAWSGVLAVLLALALVPRWYLLDDGREYALRLGFAIVVVAPLAALVAAVGSQPAMGRGPTATRRLRLARALALSLVVLLLAGLLVFLALVGMNWLSSA